MKDVQIVCFLKFFKLLYPEAYLVKDYYAAIGQDLFLTENRAQLGKKVDFIYADLCKKNKTEMTITETILEELRPGYYLEIEDETAGNVYTLVHNLTYGDMGMKVIRMVKLDVRKRGTA